MADAHRGPRYQLAMAAAKATQAALTAAHRNGGQLPGVIAEKIDPQILADVPRPKTVVCVSGTNGKTTTNNLLNDLLADNEYEVVNNRAGGNVANGIQSTLIRNATMSGGTKKDMAVMELDELSFRKVLPYLTPDIILVTNLYRDSFSRNANPDFIFNVMSHYVSPKTKLVLNAAAWPTTPPSPRALSATSRPAPSAAASSSTTTATCATWATQRARAAVLPTPSLTTSSPRLTARPILSPSASARTRARPRTPIATATTPSPICTISSPLLLWPVSWGFLPRPLAPRWSAAST